MFDNVQDFLFNYTVTGIVNYQCALVEEAKI